MILEQDSQDRTKIMAVSDLLEEFLRRSPHRTSWADVRSIAKRALQDLFLANGALLIRELTAQTSALLTETEPLNEATEQLNQAAVEIAFDGFIDSLDKAQIILSGLNQIRENFEGEGSVPETILGMIETIDSILEELGDSVETES